MSKPRLLDAYTRDSCTITSTDLSYAKVGKWADNNPDNEDRIGYFVSLSDGDNIVKADRNSKVLGVTVESPGFSNNFTKDKYDENCNLLQQYDYVNFLGYSIVIDNNTCTVNGRCIPGDDGTAIPSNSDSGYRVIERIDDNRILILVEPQEDEIHRVKEVVLDGCSIKILSEDEYSNLEVYDASTLYFCYENDREE